MSPSGTMSTDNEGLTASGSRRGIGKEWGWEGDREGVGVGGGSGRGGGGRGIGKGWGWEGDWEGVGVGGGLGRDGTDLLIQHQLKYWQNHMLVGEYLTFVSHLQPHHHTQQIPSPVLLSDPPKKVRAQPSSARYTASP